MIKVDCVSRASNLLKRKTPVVSNLGLPAKVVLGSLAAKAVDSFVMKCSDYEASDDNCHSDYWCGLAYP